MQKLDRKLALQQLKFADEQHRDKWQSILNMDMMSSEESSVEIGEEIFVVKPLRWRAIDVDTMFRKLDAQVQSKVTTSSPLEQEACDFFNPVN